MTIATEHSARVPAGAVDASPGAAAIRAAFLCTATSRHKSEWVYRYLSECWVSKETVAYMSSLTFVCCNEAPPVDS